MLTPKVTEITRAGSAWTRPAPRPAGPLGGAGRTS
jgi:hypothetical protein